MKYLSKLSWLSVVLALVWSSAVFAAPTGSYPVIEQAHVGYPQHMVVVGDSISRAANATGSPGEYPELVWATGSDPQIVSHASWIISATGVLTRDNVAVSGADSFGIPAQVANVNPAVDYVTLLIGGNDACAPNESGMTSLADFEANISQSLTLLSQNNPNARILVVSIPNLYQLWDILKNNGSARFAWNLFNICQSMLANPQSTAQADVDRRARVRQRVIDYNAVLAEECAALIHCRFDNNASFNTEFLARDVSSLDYFHPSVAGQAKISAVSYQAGFDFTDMQAPVTSVSETPAGLILAATDNVAVSGIEYKLNGSAWQRYTSMLTLNTGDMVEFRAVDVNGNSEASRMLTWTIPTDPGYTTFIPLIRR